MNVVTSPPHGSLVEEVRKSFVAVDRIVLRIVSHVTWLCGPLSCLLLVYLSDLRLHLHHLASLSPVTHTQCQHSTPITHCFITGVRLRLTLFLDGLIVT